MHAISCCAETSPARQKQVKYTCIYNVSTSCTDAEYIICPQMNQEKMKIRGFLLTLLKIKSMI